MKISFQSKGEFDKSRAWLAGVLNRAPVDMLRQIARDGEIALATNTPRDTGQTAAGWTSEIISKGGKSEVAWMNTAHPEASANVAKLIDTGHGTRNGGYVPPNPYIERAMDSVWKNTGDRLVEELIK